MALRAKRNPACLALSFETFVTFVVRSTLASLAGFLGGVWEAYDMAIASLQAPKEQP